MEEFLRSSVFRGPIRRDMYSRMDEKVTGSPRGRLNSEFLKAKRELKRIIFALFPRIMSKNNEHLLQKVCCMVNGRYKAILITRERCSNWKTQNISKGLIFFITETTPPMKSLVQTSMFCPQFHLLSIT